tara:strand:+ start:2145 stop:2321 length:177 start_codon:yes stop_codon:yes gene_type:complete
VIAKSRAESILEGSIQTRSGSFRNVNVKQFNIHQWITQDNFLSCPENNDIPIYIDKLM